MDCAYIENNRYQEWTAFAESALEKHIKEAILNIDLNKLAQFFDPNSNNLTVDQLRFELDGNIYGTPLHYAAMYRCWDVLAFLLLNGGAHLSLKISDISTMNLLNDIPGSLGYLLFSLVTLEEIKLSNGELLKLIDRLINGRDAGNDCEIDDVDSYKFSKERRKELFDRNFFDQVELEQVLLERFSDLDEITRILNNQGEFHFEWPID